jgi:general secretion pathway protein I
MREIDQAGMRTGLLSTRGFERSVPRAWSEAVPMGIGGPESGRREMTGRKGFTLLEVLVALSIVAVSVTVVVQLLSSNVRTIVTSEDYLAAGFRAETRMREVLDDPKLTEKAWSEATDDGYRTDVTIAAVMEERTQNLPVRLLEITLTTHWKKGLRDRSLVLKTVKMVNRFESESTPDI